MHLDLVERGLEENDPALIALSSYPSFRESVESNKEDRLEMLRKAVDKWGLTPLTTLLNAAEGRKEEVEWMRNLGGDRGMAGKAVGLAFSTCSWKSRAIHELGDGWLALLTNDEGGSLFRKREDGAVRAPNEYGHALSGNNWESLRKFNYKPLLGSHNRMELPMTELKNGRPWGDNVVRLSIREMSKEAMQDWMGVMQELFAAYDGSLKGAMILEFIDGSGMSAFEGARVRVEKWDLEVSGAREAYLTRVEVAETKPSKRRI